MRLIKDSFTILLSNLVKQLVTIITGLLIPRILGPSKSGMLNGMRMILDWASVSDFGTGNGLSKEIPYLRGRKTPETIPDLHNTVFTFMLVSSLLFSFILAVAIIRIDRTQHFPSQFYYGSILLAVFSPFVCVYQFLWGRLRADNAFTIIARMQYVWAIIFAIMTLSLIWKCGLYGVLAGIIGAYVLSTSYGFYRSGYRFRFSLNKNVLFRMAKIGFPLTLAAFIPIVWLSIDRFIIGKFLGWEQLGLYALGLEMAVYVCALPAQFVHALVPRIYETAGYDPASVRKFIIKPTIILLFITMTLSLGIYLAVPFIVAQVYPSFMACLTSAKILLISRSFMSLAIISGFVFAAFNKSYLLVILQLTTLCLIGAFDYIAVANGWGIKGVAIASGTAVILYSMTSCFAAYYLPKRDFTGILRLILPLFVIIVVFISGVMLIDTILPFKHADGSTENLVYRMALYGALVAALLLFLEKHTGIIQEIRSTYNLK